jgi:DNA-binding NarL/FixJ family response regulator
VPISILVADDSAVIRHSLRACIEQDPELKVCGEAENGQVAVKKVQDLKPDVVILDWQMPVMDGLDAARHISRIAPETPVVMLTLHDREDLLKKARAVGVRHVFSKVEGVGDLIASLKNISRTISRTA